MAHKNRSNQSPMKRAFKTKTGVHRTPTRILSTNEVNDRLYDFFRNHDMSWVTHAERIKCAEFYTLLMENQKTQNFTRLMEFHEVALKHFVDCLILKQLTTFQFPLIDVGTGPGFPGIPLKILFPEERILLAEGVQKRVEFLKVVREQLGLRSLDIVGRNINEWFLYPVRGVITRAVEDVGNTLGNVINCLQVGGRVYLMKGPGVDPEIQPALAKWGHVYKMIEDLPYTLPKTTQKRRLLVFEKYQATPLPDLDDEPWPEGDE